jgi:hypothetical protein
MFLTMHRSRLTGALLASVLAWMAAAPLLAVTCVPGHECPLAGGMSMQAMSAEGGASVAAPDCCRRSERRSESGTVQRTVQLKLESSPAAVRVAVFEPTPATSRRAPTLERHSASEVPLYTLHSILLI